MSLDERTSYLKLSWLTLYILQTKYEYLPIKCFHHHVFNSFCSATSLDNLKSFLKAFYHKGRPLRQWPELCAENFIDYFMCFISIVNIEYRLVAMIISCMILILWKFVLIFTFWLLLCILCSKIKYKWLIPAPKYSSMHWISLHSSYSTYSSSVQYQVWHTVGNSLILP